MTAKRKSAKTAGELAAELRQDPDFMARQRENLERELSNRRMYREAASPLLAELASVGYPVRTVGELRQLGREYGTAVPVLSRWLSRIEDRYVKEDVIRSLSVPWARPAAQALIEEYRTVTDDTGTGLRWAIGNALETIADDRVFDDVASLAKDQSYGRAREMVVAALGNMHDRRALPLLLELANDPAVAPYALIGLGKLGAEEARPVVSRFLDHPEAWVRREAKRALVRIDKASVIRRRASG
jgi:HEAT repeat protein